MGGSGNYFTTEARRARSWGRLGLGILTDGSKGSEGLGFCFFNHR